jgi:hypothetical protein
MPRILSGDEILYVESSGQVFGTHEKKEARFRFIFPYARSKTFAFRAKGFYQLKCRGKLAHQLFSPASGN